MQSAFFLLQSGLQAEAREDAEARGAGKEAAKNRATRVSVACQAALDEDMDEVILEGGSLEKGLPEFPKVEGSRADRQRFKKTQSVVFNRSKSKGISRTFPEDVRSTNYASRESGVLSLTIPRNKVATVSNVTATDVKKPVLINAEQGIRNVTKKNQPVKSHASTG